jgi:hypothetical protein
MTTQSVDAATHRRSMLRVSDRVVATVSAVPFADKTFLYLTFQIEANKAIRNQRRLLRPT